MSKISVIVPSYNHAEFLKQRIDTILNQSFKDFELIILDDCSNDDSMAIINQYKNNPHISHIIINQVNSGSPFIQWQKGIELAKGEYIWIAESDDYSDLSFLEEVMKKFDSHSEIGVVYSDSNVIREKITSHDFYFYKKHRNDLFDTNRWNKDFINEGKSEINEFLIFECTINNTSSMVFKKSLVKNYIFKNLNLFKYSGDWYFFLTIINNNCKIAYISKPLNFNRKGIDNFKKGVRSKLNYFKERTLVRFLAINELQLSEDVLQKVITRLKHEMTYQIVSLIKLKTKPYHFYLVFRELYRIDKNLFLPCLKESAKALLY